MSVSADLAQVFADWGSVCFVRFEKAAEPQEIIMIVSGKGSGELASGSFLSGFMDSGNAAKNADWAYGLIWADDCPEGMSAKQKLFVTESSGERWECDAARAVYDINPADKIKRIVAWRLRLRGEQRIVRNN